MEKSGKKDGVGSASRGKRILVLNFYLIPYKVYSGCLFWTTAECMLEYIIVNLLLYNHGQKKLHFSMQR